MSSKVSGMSWDLGLPPAEQLVLQAMADHADHSGDNCFPSISLIAEKTGYSRRHVRRIQQRLREAGIIVRTAVKWGRQRAGRGVSGMVYSINLDAVPGKAEGDADEGDADERDRTPNGSKGPVPGAPTVPVNEYEPDHCSPPGATLRETMECRGMTVEELYRALGITPAEMDDVLIGAAPITDDMAKRLEALLDVPATFWINRERSYREGLAKGLTVVTVGGEETVESRQERPGSESSNNGDNGDMVSCIPAGYRDTVSCVPTGNRDLGGQTMGTSRPVRTKDLTKGEVRTPADGTENGDDMVPDVLERVVFLVYRHVPPALPSWIDMYGLENVEQAVARTFKRGKTSPGFTQAILEAWRKQEGRDGEDEYASLLEHLGEAPVSGKDDEEGWTI